MSEEVETLIIREKAVMCSNTLESLRLELGFETSREIIERAAFELADRLWLVEQALLNENFKEAKTITASMIAVCDQIGLSNFSWCAESLMDAIRTNDQHAIYAVGMRFSRVGEASLKQAVEIAQRAV